MSKDLMNIDGNIKKIQKENLTPYKIATVILIKEYCTENMKAIVERRDFCLAALKLIQSPDMELTALLNMLYSPEYLLHRFAHQLDVQLNVLKGEGIEGLLDLFESLGRLMKPALDHSLSLPALNKNSVLGLYVRRIIIFFEKLPFDQVVSLYDALKKYIDKRGNMENTGISNTTSLKAEESYSCKDVRDKPKTAWGGRQAELLVAQQAHALQTDEHKAIPPTELQTLVRELLSCSPYYAEAHYLSYLNCLRVNEYCGALDSLYHCFDRLAPLENRSTSEDRTRTFRYAALNLAVLHTQFNHNGGDYASGVQIVSVANHKTFWPHCTGENRPLYILFSFDACYRNVALCALKEAIMMAQEAGDNICLQLAHAWMYHLSTEQKGPLIERSVGKASMLGITHTTGLGLIAYAHNSALEAKYPAQVFETLIKSDVLNCQHSMIDLMSMTYAEKSALWAYYGKVEMSSVCAQLLLLHNTGDKKQHMFNGPSTCQAVVNIANILVEFGEYNLVDIILAHAKERFPNEPCNKIWMLSEQLYVFTQMMRHGKWSEAEAIALHISSLDSLECKFRLAEVCLAKGDYPKALQHIDSIDKNSDITAQNKVRAMMLLSQITCASASSENRVAGVNSLVHLNKALELATRNHLSYYEALIKMHLANIQIVMGMPTLAMTLVEEAIIQILAHGGCYDQGRAFVLYAKCLVATAPPSPAETRKSIVLNATKALDKAKDHFAKIEALGRIKTTLYLQGILYNEVDLKTERNQCAFEFRQIDEQFPAKLENICLY